MNKKSICVAGWYYWPEFYQYLFELKKDYNVYVVAHKYNEILDKLGFEYVVTKNIAFEYGAFSWFIENKWDKKSDAIFIQDDLIMKKKDAIKILFDQSKQSGYDFIRWGESKHKMPGSRCIFASRKILEVIKKEFGGLTFDKFNFGYMRGDLVFYDKLYKDGKIGSSFNHSSPVFLKYGIKTCPILTTNNIIFCRKGVHPKKKKKLLDGIPYKLSDNSVFNIKLKNEMNEYAKKICPERSFDGFDGKGYTKWYDFCFQNIKNEKLDIVEFLVPNQKPLDMWKKYFKNSSVVGIEDGKDIKSSVPTLEYGLDIIIDNGCHAQDRIDIFEEVFDKLNPGGIYIFENLRQGYEDNKNRVVEYLKEKLDTINLHGRDDYPNYEQFVYHKNDKMGHYEKRIASIQFYFDVCIIFKRYCR